jgi:hypothetical protein
MCKITLTMLAGLMIASLATLASAGEPHDAGFKARGMKNAPPRARYYSYSTPAPALAPAPVLGRQSFSYAPSGTGIEPSAAATNATMAPAPIARQAPSYRTYSYAPVQRSYPVYRSHRHSGYSGDYVSKATLYR